MSRNNLNIMKNSKPEIKLSKKAQDLELGIYDHFKGKKYEVLGVVVHSETLEELVLYRVLGKELLWVRPLEMFTSEKTIPDGTKVKRFKFLSSK